MGAISIGSSDPFPLSLVCGEKRMRDMERAVTCGRKI